MAYFIVQKTHGRDGVGHFATYYTAGAELLHGDSPYQTWMTESAMTPRESPFALMLLSPFSFLPQAMAAAIYYFLILLSYLILGLALVYVVEGQLRLKFNRGWVIALSVLMMLDHLERELQIGNITVFLLLAAMALFLFSRRMQEIPAGILLGMLILCRPIFVILVPLFVLRKQWKTIGFAAMSSAVGVMMPMLFLGQHRAADVTLFWYYDVVEWPSSTGVGNTIFLLYDRYIAAPLGVELQSLSLLLMMGIVAMALIWFMVRNRNSVSARYYEFVEYFLLVALVPSLVATDTEQFMWTWPLVTLSVALVFSDLVVRKWPFVVLLVLAFVPFCLNSPDIVGRKLQLLFDEQGLIGLANLVLVSLTVYLFVRFIPTKKLSGR
jgi:hypothetical protein